MLHLNDSKPAPSKSFMQEHVTMSRWRSLLLKAGTQEKVTCIRILYGQKCQE